MSPAELVGKGMTDPVRLFVKGEPHPQKKILTKRWRLIMAISIVDQLVERILSDAQNKAEINDWKECPSTPGISLTDDAELKEFYDKIQSQSGEIAEADVTGWDWSVKEWELHLEADMRADLCDADDWLRRIFHNREHCVANALYCLPDGRLIEKIVPGVQCSGRYNTSSTNSRLRVAVAAFCGAGWAFAMGDDCVEEYQEDAEKLYLALGHPLKMYNKRSDEFEFCSNVFTKDLVYPSDGTKTLYNLIEQKNIDAMLMNQFQMEMRHHPRREEFLECTSRVVAGNGGQKLTQLSFENGSTEETRR